MKSLLLICLSFILLSSPVQARNVQAELQSIQKQKQLIRQTQKDLGKELGQVGENLKKLDVQLLSARHAYRQVRSDIKDVDQRLDLLSTKITDIKKSMQHLHKQMFREASAAYQQKRTQSVWVSMLSDVSITELPHRQHLLKYALISQEEVRQAWQEKMEQLNAAEQDEQTNKDKLLVLKAERKNAERELVISIANKKKSAEALRSDIQKKKAQEYRLAKQEKALKRLLDGLADTLLASDKKTTTTSIRKKKGHLSWPLQGSIMVKFGQSTSTGVKLSGVHLSPSKRNEQGKLVKALGQGQVRYSDWFGGYGLMMIVDYGHGIMAVYAHNDALHKQLGDWVEKDEILAEAGSTGWVDDIRLYFEIRDKGKPVNPTRWCKK